jgi:hypothetical protein
VTVLNSISLSQDKAANPAKAPRKKLLYLNTEGVLDVDDVEGPYDNEYDDDSMSDDKVDESRGDIGNNTILLSRERTAVQETPPKPEDFPQLERGQEADDLDSFEFSSEEEDVASIVNVRESLHLNATEEWDVISDAGTVISMDSKSRPSYRDALCNSGTKLNSATHCSSILAFNWMSWKQNNAA